MLVNGATNVGAGCFEEEKMCVEPQSCSIEQRYLEVMKRLQFGEFFFNYF